METFYKFVMVIVALWVPATAVALGMLVVMLIRRATRSLVMVPLALVGLCLGPYLMFLFGRPSGNEVLLNSIALLFAAPSVFVASAGCALAIAALRRKRPEDPQPSRMLSRHSGWLTLNVGFALAILIVQLVFYPFYRLPSEWPMSPSEWIVATGIVHWMAKISVPLAHFARYLLDYILFAAVFVLLFRASRADRWIHVGVRGWELLLLVNILELLRAIAQSFPRLSGAANERIFVFGPPITALALVGIVTLVCFQFTPQVRILLLQSRYGGAKGGGDGGSPGIKPAG